MNRAKKIFSGIIWSIITNIFNALYGFILIPILIRYFGKAEYGLIGLAMSINAYMQLMDMGLTSTNIRFFSNWLAKGDNERVRKLFSTCTAFYSVVGLINAIIIIGIYFFSSRIFNVSPAQDIILKKLLIILAVSAIVNWTTTCFYQIIQATENVAWTQKRLFLTKILMVLVLVITVIGKLNLTQYFFLTVVCNWLILPWVIRKIKVVAPMVSFKVIFNKDVLLEILPYSLSIFSFTIFSFSYKNLKTVFLGIQGTCEDVTDYQVIMGIISICSAVSSVFMTALLPSSSKAIAQNDRHTYYRIAYQGTKYITLFTVFCVFGMMTIDKDLLTLYVGKDYLYLIPALNLTLLTLLGNHILGISTLILGGEDIRPLSVMTAISSTISLVVCWFLIPSYKIMGVAIASMVYNIVQMLFYYLYYFPHYMQIDSWKLFSRILFPITSFGCTLYFITILLPSINNHWINVIYLGGIYSLLFIMGSLFYCNQNDKDFIASLLFKKKKKN